jgi:hypothetical protein
LIAIGEKKIETRSWYTDYRGPIAIHAAKITPAQWDDINDPDNDLAAMVRGASPAAIKADDYENPFDALRAQMKAIATADIPSGAIVATAQLVDCIRMTPAFIAGIHDFELEAGHYAVGRFAWVLEDVSPLPEPVVTRGYQGIWDWDEVTS